MNTNYMSTILDFKNVAFIAEVRITMNTANESTILGNWNRNLIKSTKCDNGLYFFDTDASENHSVAEDSTNNYTKQVINNYYMLTTISNDKEFYIQQEI